MGKPAARLTDMHTCPMVTPGLPPIPHVGGPISGPCVPTVLIGMMPAATVGDMCVCVGPPDSIAMGSPTVFIGNKMAARMGDPTVHGGVIVLGFPTVLIGEVGSGGAVSQSSPPPVLSSLQEPDSDSGATAGLFQFVENTIEKIKGAFVTPFSNRSNGANADKTNSQEAEIERKNAEHQKRADFSKSTSPQQKKKDSCALMSVRSVLAEATIVGQKCLVKPANPPSEDQMAEIGTKSKAYVDCNGTTDESKIFEAVGIETISKSKPSLDDIAKALDEGKGVVVGYDTRKVWGGQAAKSPKPLGHAVRVTGVIRDPKSGKISSLLINDTGDGTPKAVSAATFEEALKWPYSRMTETKYPLHPPI